MPIAFVLGSVAPYNNRLFDAFCARHGADLTVYQCNHIEPSRRWRLPQAQNYRQTTLKGFGLHRSDIRHIYFNPGIIPELARQRPRCVIISGFSPTMILAGLYAVATGTPLGLLVEGSRDLDPGEHSWAHARVRRFFGPRAAFGFCTSEASAEMMVSWGLARERCVIVPHAGSWPAPDSVPSFAERTFDIVVCGTLNERKNPLFIVEVARKIAAAGRKPRVRFVGDGELRAQVAEGLASAGVDVQFDGYLQQDEIIKAYQSAKVVMFPTLADTWGLVANEAMLAGTPILSSPHAISASDLVTRFETGLVKPLDAGQWAAAFLDMTASAAAWSRFLARREEAMAWFGIENSADCMAKAIAMGTAGRGQREAHRAA